MGNNTSTITSFTKLNTWKEGHKLVLSTYQAPKSFPSEERFALTDQIRRCVVSVTSNIAEGFSRQSSKEKNQFYYTAKGSLTEIQNQLLIARDVEYLTQETFSSLADQTIVVGKLLTGLIKSTKKI